MPTELVDHRLAEDRTFGRVMEKVEPDEAGVEVAIYHRKSISEYDIEIRGYPQPQTKSKLYKVKALRVSAFAATSRRSGSGRDSGDAREPTARARSAFLPPQSPTRTRLDEIALSDRARQRWQAAIRLHP